MQHFRNVAVPSLRLVLEK